MNSFSCMSNLKRNSGMNPNSLPFINKYTKILSLGVSGGTYFSDLSATALYSRTSMGLNLTNNNTNYAVVNYNGIAMKTTDIASSDLTIYTKYKCRTNTLPILNFRFPNVITTSLATVSVGDTFTIKMFSLLEPGTLVPYSITGSVTSDNLSNAILNGTLTAPYQSITYTIASGGGSTIVYNVSGSKQSIIIPNLLG